MPPLPPAFARRARERLAGASGWTARADRVRRRRGRATTPPTPFPSGPKPLPLPVRAAPARAPTGFWDGAAAGRSSRRPPSRTRPCGTGPSPACAELAAALGCPVRPLEELPGAPGRQAVTATLPAPDLETCRRPDRAARPPGSPGASARRSTSRWPTRLIELRLRARRRRRSPSCARPPPATAAAHARRHGAPPGPGIRESRGARGDGGRADRARHDRGLRLDRHGARRGPAQRASTTTCSGRATCCWPTWAPRPRAAGRATSPAPGRCRALFAHPARICTRWCWRRSSATIAAVTPGRPLPRPAPAGRADAGRGAGRAGHLARRSRRAGRRRRGRLLFPHGIGHLLGLDVHDMEDLGRPRRLRARRARAPSDFGLRYLRLDRDLRRAWRSPSSPASTSSRPSSTTRAGAAAPATASIATRLAQFADVRGIRIEDDVLVTATGHEVLTKAIPKRPAEVEMAVSPAA